MGEIEDRTRRQPAESPHKRTENGREDPKNKVSQKTLNGISPREPPHKGLYLIIRKSPSWLGLIISIWK